MWKPIVWTVFSLTQGFADVQQFMPVCVPETSARKKILFKRAKDQENKLVIDAILVTVGKAIWK